MTARKYSIAEIARMRRAIEHWYLYGCAINSPRAETLYVSRAYKRADKVREVEERLRTHMIAGVEPEELEGSPKAESEEA